MPNNKTKNLTQKCLLYRRRLEENSWRSREADVG